jgi:hypothetical protein
MSVSPITDELVNRAFQLAYFILGERAASIYVATTAIDKLKAAATTQDRRLYYIPTGRLSSPATRTKLNLSTVHLLQRLIYIESELFERLIEGRERSLKQEDMIIRYIKHLIRITTKHNSFYVTLGLSRLLYNYTTAETSEIYNLVLQDPNRTRDDHYYRSRKKQLMQEIRDRFGNLISAQRSLRREERFQPQENSAQYAWLVERCLEKFTPWQSTCVLPNKLEPKINILKELSFEGGDPDEEHVIELNRIHALSHPACFGRLMASLGLGKPAERLELPYFSVPSDGVGLSDDRFNPGQLTDGELSAIRRYLEKNSSHRRSCSEEEMIVLIDQVRRAAFKPNRSDRVVFDISMGTELIEIDSVTLEERIPLVVCPVEYGTSGISRASSSTVLPEGSQFSFRVEPRTNNFDNAGDATITISYEPQVAAEALSASFDRLKLWFKELLGQRSLGRAGALRLALGALVVAVVVAGFWIYRHTRGQKVAPSLIAQRDEKNVNENPPQSQTPQSSVTTSQNSAPLKKASPGVVRTESERSPDSNESSEQTRGASRIIAAKTLGSVKRVYVDTLGTNQLSEQLRKLLVTGLTNHFVVVANRDEADTVFKGSVTQVNNGRTLEISVEMVNVSGQSIWSFSTKHGREKFSNAADASAKVLNALRRDLED